MVPAGARQLLEEFGGKASTVWVENTALAGGAVECTQCVIVMLRDVFAVNNTAQEGGVLHTVQQDAGHGTGGREGVG